MVNLTGIQQKTVLLITYHSSFMACWWVLLVRSLWLSIDPLFIPVWLPTPILVGWLVGAAHYFVGWQAARGRQNGSSCAVVLSTILVAVSENCVLGNPPMACLLFRWPKVSGKAQDRGLYRAAQRLGQFF
jgi:hypothetical protein